MELLSTGALTLEPLTPLGLQTLTLKHMFNGLAWWASV